MRTVPIRVDGIVIEPVLHHDRAGLRASVSAETAAMLAALPVPQGLRDRVIVVKFGGNAMVDDELQRAFADDMVHLRSLGVRPVVVHGGGPQISAMLERLGIESEFRGGYRVTSEAAIDVVRMVLTGTITRSIVSRINVHGPVAAGVSGEDAGLFTARRRGTIVDGVEVDLGFVGDVVKVDPSLVVSLLDSGRIPVVSSIASDGDAPGASLNVNADAAAAALALALGAEKLVILTDVPGLYRDWPDTASLVTTITAADVRALLPRLESGMIPKMTACVHAVEGGVRAASVVDGRVPHSALREIVLERSTGTVVIA